MKTKQTNARRTDRGILPFQRQPSLHGWSKSIAFLLTLLFWSVGLPRVWGAATNDVTLGSISALTIYENCASTNVSLTGIAGGGGGVIGITASSSDTAIVPDPTVTYTSPNATGTLALKPVTNAFGSATITVIATNDKPSAVTNTFTVTVSPINKVPYFTLSTNIVATTETNASVTMSNFLTGISVGRTNETNQTFTFTLTGASAAIFSAGPAIDTNGTLTFTVINDKWGTNTIGIKMQDSGLTANGGKDTATNAFAIRVANIHDDSPVIILPTNTVASLATNYLFINENSGATNLALTVTNLDVPLIALKVSSSDSNLFKGSLGSKDASSTNTSRTLTITTVTNQYGTGVVTLVASDIYTSTTNTFTVGVASINHAPTGAKLNAVTVKEDGGAFNITNVVAKLHGNVTNITLSFESTNTSLVAVSNIVASTSASFLGTNRMFTITPTTNLNGTTLISVIYTDTNSASTTNTFLLTVSAVNDRPSFDLTSRLVVLAKNAAATNIANFATNIYAGASNETLSAKAAFTLKTGTPKAFKTLTLGTNGTLAIEVATNTTGYFPIYASLNDGGGTANGGKDISTTNVFFVVVTNVTSGLSLSMPSSVTVDENKSTNVTVKIIDADRVNVNIVVTSSTNRVKATLIGTGMTRSLLIAPWYPAPASATIRLVADDGVSKATNTLAVTVNSVLYPPTLGSFTNLTILENAGVTNVEVFVASANDLVLTNNYLTNVTTTAYAVNTNLVSLTVTNTDPTNRVLVITTVTNNFGSTVVGVVASQGTNNTTNTFLLTLLPVNNAPSFEFNTNAFATLTTNTLIVGENGNAKATKGVTYTNVITSLVAGPTNESKQKLTLAVTTSSNAFFKVAPSVTTKGDLAFLPALYATGTVTLSIYAKDDGGTSNGGVNTSATNVLTLIVTNANNAPVLGTLANLKLLERAAATNLPISVTDPDHALTNLALWASIDKTNLATVTPLTNNGSFYLTIRPATNGYNSSTWTNTDKIPLGAATVTVAVGDGSLWTTNTFALTIDPVNDQPTFSILTNRIDVTEYNVPITVSNFLYNVVTGPTSDETNQAWTITTIYGADQKNFFVKAPAIDKNGTLTFTPSTNSGVVALDITVKDKGGTKNGGVDTSAVSELFINFPDSPFTTLAGQYNGLFADTTNSAVTFNRSGYLQLTVNSVGGFKGYLLQAGVSNTFTGQFSTDDQTASVTLTNLSETLALTLQTNGTEMISGTLTHTTSPLWQSTVEAYLSVVGTDRYVPIVGDFTLSITGAHDAGASTPPGDAALRMSVDTTGLATIGGQLADGTVVTQRVGISFFGEIPLYLQAYGRGSNGTVLGKITFVTDPSTNSNNKILSENTGWFKTSSAGGTYYASGFTNAPLTLVASDYNTWNGLWLDNVQAVVGGGNMSAAITNYVTVDYDYVTVNTNNCSLSLAIDPATGYLTGSFIDPSSSLTNTIKGVVIQQSEDARGYFMGTNRAGYFQLNVLPPM